MHIPSSSTSWLQRALSSFLLRLLCGTPTSAQDSPCRKVSCMHAQVAEVEEEEEEYFCADGLNRSHSSGSEEAAQPQSRDTSRLSSAGTAACRLADVFEDGEEPDRASAGAHLSLVSSHSLHGPNVCGMPCWPVRSAGCMLQHTPILFLPGLPASEWSMMQ